MSIITNRCIRNVLKNTVACKLHQTFVHANLFRANHGAKSAFIRVKYLNDIFCEIADKADLIVLLETIRYCCIQLANAYINSTIRNARLDPVHRLDEKENQ